MKFLERIFRHIFWLVVTAGIAWIVKKMFEKPAGQTQFGDAGGRMRVHSQPSPKKLFRDPACGAYVAEEISYPWKQGSETLHFCSRECLEKYCAADRIAAGA